MLSSSTTTTQLEGRIVEFQMAFTPPLNIIVRITRSMRRVFVENSSTPPEDMIHQVFLELKDQIRTEERLFKQFVRRMIATYLDLHQQIGYADSFDGPTHRHLNLACPYFMELHDALRLSDYYRNLPRPPPKTSSTNTTLSVDD